MMFGGVGPGFSDLLLASVNARPIDANGAGANDHRTTISETASPTIEHNSNPPPRIFSSEEYDQCKLYRCKMCGHVFCIVCDVPTPGVREILVKWGVHCPSCLEFSTSLVHRVQYYSDKVMRDGK